MVKIMTSNEKNVKKIKFAKNFKKLDNIIFTTIRTKNKQLKLDELVTIKTPTKSFYATVIGCKKTHLFHEEKLVSIDKQILIDDLDIKNEKSNDVFKEKVINTLKEFYPYVTEKSTVYLYTFRSLREELHDN